MKKTNPPITVAVTIILLQVIVLWIKMLNHIIPWLLLLALAHGRQPFTCLPYFHERIYRGAAPGPFSSSDWSSPSCSGSNMDKKTTLWYQVWSTPTICRKSSKNVSFFFILLILFISTIKANLCLLLFLGQNVQRLSGLVIPSHTKMAADG